MHMTIGRWAIKYLKQLKWWAKEYILSKEKIDICHFNYLKMFLSFCFYLFIYFTNCWICMNESTCAHSANSNATFHVNNWVQHYECLPGETVHLWCLLKSPSIDLQTCSWSSYYVKLLHSLESICFVSAGHRDGSFGFVTLKNNRPASAIIGWI